MGMHVGLVAVPASVEALHEEFSVAWPKYQVRSSQAGFTTPEHLWHWKESNEVFVSAATWSKDNPGTEVFVFCQDSRWATLMDSSYLLASDEAALGALSARFGTAISFVVESAGGTAMFLCFEHGKLRRKLLTVDGHTEATGEPLPQETSISSESYYMDETDQLMSAFGLSSLATWPQVHTALAICASDVTDYSPLLSSTPTRQPKPWWKFW